MYLFYIVVKYTLHWVVITFKDFGSIVYNDVFSTCHMIAIYEGTPDLYSFFIYLYNTCYVARSVVDIRCVL